MRHRRTGVYLMGFSMDNLQTPELGTVIITYLVIMWVRGQVLESGVRF